MNKVECQEKIISLIKEKYIRDGKIDRDDVYDILNQFNFTEEDRQKRIKKGLFGFKSEIIDKNIIFEYDYKFIPFLHGEYNEEKVENAVKMYIPVAAEDLKNVYSKLKDFIKNNNIDSNNKARNRAACDDIVLRMYDLDSVEKVRNYIKNTPEIREKIKFSNPFFAHDEMMIGYSMDGIRTSVNGELSSLLAYYVKNNVNTASRDGFKQYLRNQRTEFYRMTNAPLFSSGGVNESTKVNNLLEMSMDEDFDYKKMTYYADMMQNHKEELSKMRIDDVVFNAYKDLSKRFSKDASISLVANCGALKEEYFTSPLYYILAKTYLTTDLVLDTFAKIKYEDLGSEKKSYK